MLYLLNYFVEGKYPLFLLLPMTISVETVRDLIEEKIQNTSFYILDIRISNKNQINVEIENDQPVSITDCVRSEERRVGKEC